MPYHYYKPRGPDECVTYLQNERGRRGNHHRFITEKQVFARWAKLYNISFVHPTWWEMDSKKAASLIPGDPIWPPAHLSASWDTDLKWLPATISFQCETVSLTFSSTGVRSNMARSANLQLQGDVLVLLSKSSKMVPSLKLSLMRNYFNMTTCRDKVKWLLILPKA